MSMAYPEFERKPKLLEERPNLIGVEPSKFSGVMEKLRGQVVGERPPSNIDEEAHLERSKWIKGMWEDFFKGLLPEEVGALIQVSFPEEADRTIESLKSFGRMTGELHLQIFENKLQADNQYLVITPHLRSIVYYLLQGESRPTFWSDHPLSPLAGSEYQELLFGTSAPGVFLSACRKAVPKRKETHGFMGVDEVFRSDWHWAVYLGQEPRIRTEEELKEFLKGGEGNG